MRAITSVSVGNFLNRVEFSKSNMSVENVTSCWIENKHFENVTLLKLHFNTIAVLTKNGELYISNCGWQSDTTKERLNGLPNVSIYQRNFQWYLNDEPWNGSLIRAR